ncbi:MAG: SagB/ThcOx family dehydrogenase [bacterium]
MDKRLIAQYRAFLKDSIRKHLDFSQTDQSLGRPIPPIEKPCPASAPLYDLPGPGGKGAPKCDLAGAIARRRSRRAFTGEALSLGEVGFLLWATQGVRGKVVEGHAFRTVPSAGCRHALETYVAALNVDGLGPALYRYLPLSHQLVFEREVEGLGSRLVAATLGQAFVGRAAAVFAWCALPYRMEWRYGLAAHKVIALDAGHVCQNLYLACEAIGAGTCAVAAYDQEAVDRVLGLDGEDEFAIYLAPVGKVKD